MLCISLWWSKHMISASISSCLFRSLFEQTGPNLAQTIFPFASQGLQLSSGQMIGLISVSNKWYTKTDSTVKFLKNYISFRNRPTFKWYIGRYIYIYNPFCWINNKKYVFSPPCLYKTQKKKSSETKKSFIIWPNFLHAVKPPELMLFLHPGSWRLSLLQPLRRQPQHPCRRGFRRRLPRHGRPRHGCRRCRRPRCGARAAQRATHGLQCWWRLRSLGDDGGVRTTEGWRLIWHRIHTKTASQRLLTLETFFMDWWGEPHPAFERKHFWQGIQENTVQRVSEQHVRRSENIT